MLRVGVTGGIGSGKTTLCRLFERWGARVFYADEEAKRIMVEDSSVRSEIVEAFGEEAYHPDGTLARAYLAEKVFGDPAAVEQINAIVHPRVYRAFDRFAAQADSEGAPLAVRESALLPSGAGRSGLDVLIAVMAPESTRVQRVVSRDDTATEDVRRRIGHQLDDAGFRAAADRVVENDGSLADLERKAKALFDELAGAEGRSFVTSNQTTSPMSNAYPELGPNLPRWGNAGVRIFGRLVLGMMGFRFAGPLPERKKFVIVGAPHTSNWDFVVSMSLLMALGLRVRWLGKHTIFRKPFGGIMQWMGGLPVDRSRTEGTVEQAIEAFDEHEKLIIGLSPEGTRRRVDRWKTGFYRIAVGAGVPIAIGVIDFGNRELRFDSMFEPTGDMEKDIEAIRARYRGVQGKRPQQFDVI